MAPGERAVQVLLPGCEDAVDAPPDGARHSFEGRRWRERDLEMGEPIYQDASARFEEVRCYSVDAIGPAVLTDILSFCFTLRLVPFILVLVIIEEILPLIVIYAPFMLPSTTILPSQAERIYEKREEKKRQALTQAKWYAENEKIDPSALSRLSVKELTNDLAWTVCR